MSKSEVLDLLKTIAKDVESFGRRLETIEGKIESIETNQVEDVNKAKDMFKILNAKIDVIKNLESESREAISQKSSSGKKPTKPSFMKQIFIEERDQFMNVLYTEDEINAVFDSDEVKAKKKEAERNAKAAALIYARHIKADNPAGRQSAFESIYKNRYS